MATVLDLLHSDEMQSYSSLISSFFFASHQGRHVKTGQLAAIKVMDVTEVSKHHRVFTL